MTAASGDAVPSGSDTGRGGMFLRSGSSRFISFLEGPESQKVNHSPSGSVPLCRREK